MVSFGEYARRHQAKPKPLARSQTAQPSPPVPIRSPFTQGPTIGYTGGRSFFLAKVAERGQRPTESELLAV